MCKRLVLFAAIVALVGIVTQVTAAPFYDTKNTPYETAFTALQESGVIQGYDDGLARPNAKLNRVEALKVILQARGGEYTQRIAWMRDHVPPLSLFTDTDQSQWYAPYIEVGFEYGVITGYADQTFRPGRNLTVEEAITLLMRTFKLEGKKDRTELSNYIENRASDWFTPYVNAAIDRNLIMHRGKLQLGHAITRGQFFDIVYRLQEVTDNKLKAFGGPEPAPVTPVRVATPTPVVPTTPSTTTPTVSNHPFGSEKHFAISMPTLSVEDLTITHPEDPFSKNGVLSVLANGVGHLFGYPGGGGKIMVYGHSSSYWWDYSEYTKIFRQINKLNIGDKVYVTYQGNLYTYEIAHKQSIPAGNTQEAFRDDGTGEELILYTCWPPDSISQRYLVHAFPVDTVALE